MNIVEYINPASDKRIAYCVVDDIETYANSFIKETIKNLADFTVSNIYEKINDIFVGYNEDGLINHVTDRGYNYAVVFSPGTEFINGYKFFEAVNDLTKTDFFIAGHVLDRSDAYYELHHQCYVIDLQEFKKLNRPVIGQQHLGDRHLQIIPDRSLENIHDNYTPLWIGPGSEQKNYQHKCHGWNIISVALANDKKVVTFGDEIRNNKYHYYPESQKDFLQKVSRIYFRKDYCKHQFIHKDNTEWSNGHSEKFDQLVIPASGTLYHDLIDKGTVVIYDYNEQSLEYWKKHFPFKKDIVYKFVLSDLLIDNNLLDHLDINAEKTFINFSNIFCYEGTATFYPLIYRFTREQEIIGRIKQKLPNVQFNFTGRAASAFQSDKDRLCYLKKPTWHYNQDWEL